MEVNFVLAHFFLVLVLLHLHMHILVRVFFWEGASIGAIGRHFRFGISCHLVGREKNSCGIFHEVVLLDRPLAITSLRLRTKLVAYTR